MKKSFLILFSLISCGYLIPEPIIIDKIVAHVYHPAGTRIVTLSDLHAGIEGQLRTVQDVVMDILMELEAILMKISISDEELDRYIATIMKQNGLTHTALVNFFEEMGYTYEEGKEVLRRKQMIEQFTDYKIRSNPRMVVQKQEAQEYYNQHPEKQEAVYTLQMSFVPFAKIAQKELDIMIQNNTLPSTIEWDEPFEVKASELPEERQFIAQKKEGEVVFSEKVDDGYEITKLVTIKPEQQIPFDDCYHDIVATLRQARFAEVMKELQADLLARARIVYEP